MPIIETNSDASIPIANSIGVGTILAISVCIGKATNAQ